MKLYIAVLDEVPDHMVPVLVAHAVLGAHLKFNNNEDYNFWLDNYYKKCVLKVNRKEFNKISIIPNTYLGHEVTVLNGEKSCAVPIPVHNENVPNVLKFAKLWKPYAC